MSLQARHIFISTITAMAGVLTGCAQLDAAEDTAEDTAALEPAPPRANVCEGNEGNDSSHTLKPTVTCTYIVGTSAPMDDNDVAMSITGYLVQTDKNEWVAQCWMEHLSCEGTTKAAQLSCPSPEYLATNQEITDKECAPTWKSSSKLLGIAGTYNGATLVSPHEATVACQRNFKALLDDPNGSANKLCNGYADYRTNQSKKAPICCIPEPDAPTDTSDEHEPSPEPEPTPEPSPEPSPEPTPEPTAEPRTDVR